MCLTEPGFSEKSPSGKNDRKWSKMTPKQGFSTYYENQVISFVWKWCKIKVLVVYENCKPRKNLVLKLILKSGRPKMLWFNENFSFL